MCAVSSRPCHSSTWIGRRAAQVCERRPRPIPLASPQWLDPAPVPYFWPDPVLPNGTRTPNGGVGARADATKVDAKAATHLAHPLPVKHPVPVKHSQRVGYCLHHAEEHARNMRGHGNTTCTVYCSRVVGAAEVLTARGRRNRRAGGPRPVIEGIGRSQ